MLNFLKFSKSLAIDLGTANTLTYVPSRGIVLNEPSVVAFDIQNDAVVAVGQQAKDMMGKTPPNIVVMRPIRDGVIADFKVTTTMLKYFIKKSITRCHLFPLTIVIAVPFGITPVEKRAVQEAAFQVGAKRVVLILEPMAAALGAGLPIEKPVGNMVIDIGGGTTDIAVIALTGIVCGCCIRTAGDEIDVAISRYVKQKYNLLIGLKTSEAIKKSLGSSCSGDSEQTARIRGQDLATRMPGIRKINSQEIQHAFAETLKAIEDAAIMTLEKTPPDLLIGIMEQGILLTGGGALLRNLDYKIKERTGISVVLARDSLTTVVQGAGEALTDSKLLQKISMN